MKIQFINHPMMLLIILVNITCMHLQARDTTDMVRGNLIQFNDNGGWCWYQDERAVVDPEENRLVLGSVSSHTGVGGENKRGDIETIFFDLETMQSNKYILIKGIDFFNSTDDHNSPAFLIMPNGKYLAFYTAHGYEYVSRYRIFSGNSWDPEKQFDWHEMPGILDYVVTYSNLFYLSAENRIYNISRNDNRSPNMMISDNLGETWTYGGKLSSTDINIGYVNGYYKYSSNGIDRIDFIATEHHPRDYSTSIYHGYIYNGKSYNSIGSLMDDDISDTLAPPPADFSLVFGVNEYEVEDTIMTHAWNIDLQVYPDSTIAVLLKTRADSSETDHRFFYARFAHNVWSITYLGKAGPKLYDIEQDYTGLGALHPNDPSKIFISTTIDPRDNKDLGVHEIFEGTTADHGATWIWEPITQNSEADNLRPIIPYWDNNNYILLWLRGRYTSMYNFDQAIVGLIKSNYETTELKNYVDAVPSNTYYSDGNSLIYTGPDSLRNNSDDLWHLRTTFGNGGYVITSSETNGEDAPELKTKISVPEQGIYDVWVNFWANPDEDWRIKAGLSHENMQLFRQQACEQVEDGEHTTVLIRSGKGNTFLYQAYLGRINAITSEFEVLIDDHCIMTGSIDSLQFSMARTWYDGISYAKVTINTNNKEQFLSKEQLKITCENYPNPFNNNTIISFNLPREGRVKINIYNEFGQMVTILTNEILSSGNHNIFWYAPEASAGIYYCQITTDYAAETRKMILLK